MAGRALPARRTLTREAVAAILACTAVTASSRLAVAAAKRAGFTLPATVAGAHEIRYAVYAGTVIATGFRQALVHIWKNMIFPVRERSTGLKFHLLNLS